MSASAVFAGIGCRKGATAAAIDALIDAVLAESGLCREHLAAIAAPRFKQGEAGLQALGSTVCWITDAALAEQQSRCPTHSPLAREQVGIGSVAEACALAAAGPDGRLIAARRSSGSVTCALAINEASE